MSFSSPEFSGGTVETKDDSDSAEDSKNKKKRTGSSAVRFGAIATETTPEKLVLKPAEDRPRLSGIESLLQKLRNDIPKPKDQEPVGLPVEKSVAVSTDESDKIGQSNEADVRQPESESTLTEQSEEIEPQSAELSQAEKAELKQAAQDFIEIRLENTGDQLREIPLERSDTPEAAEAAASFAYYRTMEESLENDSVELALLADSVAQQIAERIEADPEDDPDVITPGSSHDDTLTDQPDMPVESLTDADNEGDPVPMPAAGNGGNGGGNIPPQPPFDPGLPPLPPDNAGPAFGAAYSGPGGHQQFNQMPVPPAMAPNIAPAAAEDSAYDARVAGFQGLLIGLAGGYFIGRHRGRKQGAKSAERTAAPIRKSLEKQVRTMQETITAKEIQLKSLAREKLQVLTGRKDREKFVGSMLKTPSTEAVVRPAAETSRAEVVHSPVTAKAAAESGAASKRSERLPAAARILGEAPLAVAAIAAAPAAVFRPSAEKPLPGKNIAEAVPFNKNVKDFSRQELIMTAEKVTVEGATLKEMTELGRIDEPGLRRVIGEFLKGGDVTRAFAQEVKEKELQYEQDPRMRHFKDGTASQTAARAAGAGGLIVGGLFDRQPDAGLDGSTTSQPVSSESHPQPDPATLRTIRNKQAVTVAGTVLLIAVAIVVALVVSN